MLRFIQIRKCALLIARTCVLLFAKTCVLLIAKKCALLFTDYKDFHDGLIPVYKDENFPTSHIPVHGCGYNTAKCIKTHAHVHR